MSPEFKLLHVPTLGSEEKIVWAAYLRRKGVVIETQRGLTTELQRGLSLLKTYGPSGVTWALSDGRFVDGGVVARMIQKERLAPAGDSLFGDDNSQTYVLT